MKLKLAQYRESEGATQKEVAKALHVSPKTVWNWEAGTSFPNVEVLCKMCDMFHCTPCDMLGWWDDHERPADPALSPSEDEVLALYRASTPESREVIRSTAELAAQASVEAGAEEPLAHAPDLTRRRAM